MLKHRDLIFPRADSAALADRLEEIFHDPREYQRIRDYSSDRRDTFDFDWVERWEAAFTEDS